MARTTYDFKIKNNSMMGDIDLYLTKQGFRRETRKGENIYCKNLGIYSILPFISVLLEPRTCNFRFQTIGGRCVMEAWVKQEGSYGRELAVHNLRVPLNYYGWDKPYKDMLNYIKNY